jgi:hypothetical protein
VVEQIKQAISIFHRAFPPTGLQTRVLVSFPFDVSVVGCVSFVSRLGCFFKKKCLSIMFVVIVASALDVEFYWFYAVDMSNCSL